ncbi:adenylyl-sulfate kinase [Vibrio cincinnatiensis]|nr:AAA family ATPase [Vibrio cincinnatiensis]MCG3729132.1 adenylyl-sulfate kinase [Vibrio cincinnatiensis]
MPLRSEVEVRVSIPTLYIFSGLPGSGKSTLAQLLAKRIGAVYLRIDTVEQGLRDLCHFKVESEGYRLSYRIAQDNLIVGNCVIADSCNPIALTRHEWQEVAESTGARFINIEIRCSDLAEHEYRINTRRCSISTLQQPTWQQVQARYYEPWNSDVIHLDTAGKAIAFSLSELSEKLSI